MCHVSAVSHQNDVARTRHEGDRTRQGVEEKLMATEKEIFQLRSDFEHDTDREKNLILQLKETKQQNEELRISTLSFRSFATFYYTSQ